MKPMYKLSAAVSVAFLMPIMVIRGGESADKVAADINGIVIYEKELAYPLPPGAFESEAGKIRDLRLARLLRSRLVARFLQQEKITVATVAIEQAWAKLHANPPSAGCACCRYSSLEAFMETNYFRPDEFRAELTNELGLQQYLDRQWKLAYPAGDAGKKHLEQEKPRLQQEYGKASHIFFNVIQNPDYANDPDKVLQQAHARAEAVWQRLRKGEPFDRLVKESSDDAGSKDRGGLLGCAPLYGFQFGPAFTKTLTELQPGTYSQPIESAWGVHIIRREPMSDQDYLDILRENFENELRNKIEKQLDATGPGK